MATSKSRKSDSTAQEAPLSPTQEDAAENLSDETDQSTAASREERVRQAAYRRYQERGGTHGNDAQDWLDAEAEIDRSSRSERSS